MQKNGKWAKIMVIPKIFYRYMIETIFLFCIYKIKLYLCSVNPDNKATPLAVSHWPLAKQRKQQTRNGSQPPLRGLLTPTTTSS